MSTCKDCFHSYVCKQFNEHRECDNKKCHFANDHFISADFINRLQAEVEELRAEVNHYANESDAILADIDFRDAENERLRAEIKRLKKDSNSLIFNLIPARGRGKTSVLKIKIEEIKAEAYKEFAEKYKNQIKNYTGMFTDEGFMVSFEAVLSAVNFIKDKLVGEDNEQTT